jgi:predicted nucleotidyltransferase
MANPYILVCINHTKMRSKEDAVLELFYNSGRHWHFEELIEKAGISRRQLLNWLMKFEREGLIRKVKEPGRHPYYMHNYPDPRFLNRKRLYALQRLTESGFLDHLANLDAKVIILFGSISRADWHSGSDIDVFIYGNDDGLEQGKFEGIFGREIQVFNARSKAGLKRYAGMLPAIVSGDFIKGSIHNLGVVMHA